MQNVQGHIPSVFQVNQFIFGDDILCSQVQTCVFVIPRHIKHVLGYIHNGPQVYKFSNGYDTTLSSTYMYIYL